MYYYGREKRRRFKKRVKLGIAALATIGVIILSYFVFFDTDRKPDIIYSVNSATDNALARNYQGQSAEAAMEKTGMQQDSRKGDFEVLTKTSISQSDGSKESSPQKISVSQTENVVPVRRPSNETVYQVISEAHFYNKPHERARRKDFIPYWNVSTSLKPLKEKKGFVYVKYKTPLGKTSSGWLRKKDLKKVNTFYDNSKD